MTTHKTGTREEWLAARLALLQDEKDLTRRSDDLARQRQELPWVRVDEQYRFDTDAGTASLADLFAGRSQLLVYHFMFGADYTAGCPSCSSIADGFDGFVVHLAHHDVTLCAVSRAPLAKLQAYKRRMGWSFPWASSHGGDFNHDFQAAFTLEEQRAGAGEYNFRAKDLRTPPEVGEGGPLDRWAAVSGTDWPTYAREAPGVSAFAPVASTLNDGAPDHPAGTFPHAPAGSWHVPATTTGRTPFLLSPAGWARGGPGGQHGIPARRAASITGAARRGRGRSHRRG